MKHQQQTRIVPCCKQTLNSSKRFSATSHPPPSKPSQTSMRAAIPGDLLEGVEGPPELEGGGGGSSRSPDPSPAPGPVVESSLTPPLPPLLPAPAAELIFIACIRAANPGAMRGDSVGFFSTVAPPADESALNVYQPEEKQSNKSGGSGGKTSKSRQLVKTNCSTLDNDRASYTTTYIHANTVANTRGWRPKSHQQADQQTSQDGGRGWRGRSRTRTCFLTATERHILPI